MNLSNANDILEEVTDMLKNYVCESTTLHFCNNCPELRYIEDIGSYDCPYGLSVDSCEYFPQEDIDSIASEFVSAMLDARP